MLPARYVRIFSRLPTNFSLNTKAGFLLQKNRLGRSAKGSKFEKYLVRHSQPHLLSLTLASKLPLLANSPAYNPTLPHYLIISGRRHASIDGRGYHVPVQQVWVGANATCHDAVSRRRVQDVGAFVPNFVHLRPSAVIYAVGLVEVGTLNRYWRWRDIVASNRRVWGRYYLIAWVLTMASAPGSRFYAGYSLLIALTEAA